VKQQLKFVLCILFFDLINYQMSKFQSSAQVDHHAPSAGGSDGGGTNGCLSRNLEDARRGVRESLPLSAGTN
jgi:hypothetical protein